MNDKFSNVSTKDPAPDATKYGVIWAHYYAPNEENNFIQEVDYCDYKTGAVYNIRELNRTEPLNIGRVLYNVAARRYDYIFVYDDLLWCFLDAYCLDNHFTNYDELKDDSGKKKRIPANTYCERSGSGAPYTRKIWIASIKEGSTDRHKRVHAVTFVNFAPVVGMPKFADAVKAFGLKGMYNSAKRVETFREIIHQFDECFNMVTGTPYLGEKPASWTAGGLARAYYLKRKYPYLKTNSERLNAYQRNHPANEEAELHYRDGALLLGGILYKQYGIEKKVLTGHIRKYDCNGLYSFIGRNAPEFKSFSEIEVNTYFDAKANNISLGGAAYIFKITRLVMSVKDNMPPIFTNPFNEEEHDDIYINRPYYIFSNLLDELYRFYDIHVIEVEKVIICNGHHDSTIQEYVNLFDALKRRGKKENNAAFAFMGKFFNNNLIGKFSQHTATFKSKLIEVDGVVERQYADEVQSVWKSQHFDFVRGAYIYIMARCYIMEILYGLMKFNGWKSENLYYIDTDCFITSDIMPAGLLSDYLLGNFKVENEYSVLKFITYKRYVGYDIHTGLSVKCAGIQNEALTDYIENTQDYCQCPYKEIFECIDHAEIKTPILRRCRGGGYYSYEPQKISAEYAYADEYKSI